MESEDSLYKDLVSIVETAADNVVVPKCEYDQLEAIKKEHIIHKVLHKGTCSYLADVQEELRELKKSIKQKEPESDYDKLRELLEPIEDRVNGGMIANIIEIHKDYLSEQYKGEENGK